MHLMLTVHVCGPYMNTSYNRVRRCSLHNSGRVCGSENRTQLPNMASSEGHTEVVDKLLKHGADPNMATFVRVRLRIIMICALTARVYMIRALTAS